MNLRTRVEKLETAARQRPGPFRVEDLSEAQLEEIVRSSGYDMTLLTDSELIALHGCYDGAGHYMPERMTPELAARLESIKR